MLKLWQTAFLIPGSLPNNSSKRTPSAPLNSSVERPHFRQRKSATKALFFFRNGGRERNRTAVRGFAGRLQVSNNNDLHDLPTGPPTLAAAKSTDHRCCEPIVCCVHRLKSQPTADGFQRNLQAINQSPKPAVRSSRRQRKVTDESTWSEIQRPYRIGSPDRGNGRDDRVPSRPSDSAVAAGSLLYRHVPCGGKRCSGSQTALHFVVTTNIHTIGITSATTSCTLSGHPSESIVERSDTATGPTRRARYRTVSLHQRVTASYRPDAA